MQFSKHLGLIFIGVTIFSACSKKENVVKLSSPDLYFAGSTLTADNNLIATYWKNGTMYQLVDTAKNTSAFAIIVNGNDVCVLGSRYTPNGEGFTYWKNGVPTDINSGYTGGGRTMAVQNGNVYVAGEVIDKQLTGGDRAAVYWLNGVEVSLNTNGNSSFAAAIVVNGSDIYVAGYVGHSAALWKNGVLNILNTPANSLFPSSSEAYDVIINGNDVYVAGFINGSAAYWKNGVPAVYQIPGYTSMAFGMALSGNDLYLTGFTNSGSNTVATLWKNGVAKYLTQAVSSQTNSYYLTNMFGRCVAVNNGDVYVSGQFNVQNNCYWKNGELIQIGSKPHVQSVSGMALVVK